MRRDGEFRTLRTVRRRQQFVLGKLEQLLAVIREKQRLVDELARRDLRAPLIEGEVRELGARLDGYLARLEKLREQERKLRSEGYGRPSNVGAPKRPRRSRKKRS